MEQTSSDDFIRAFALDSSGNLFAVGETGGSLNGQTNQGGTDGFLVKYNTNGVRQWTVQYGGSGNDSFTSLAIDSSNGDIYIAGGSTTASLDGQTNSGSRDVFLVKYNSSGTRQWTRFRGSAGADGLGKVVLDQPQGMIYAVGSTDTSFDGEAYGGGIQDIFTIKYDTSGNWQWTRTVGGAGMDYPSGIGIDSSSNVYSSGASYSATIDGQAQIGSGDIFLIKYNSSGTRQCSIRDGTTVSDNPEDMTCDSSGNCFVAGKTLGALTGTNAGGSDAYVLKYDSSCVRQMTVQYGSGTGGTTSDERAQSVGLDASGNIYISGWSKGAFGGGGGNLGGADHFTCQLSSAGAKQWCRFLGRGGDEESSAHIAIDDTNSFLYVGGYTDGDFFGSVNQGLLDGFIFKYSFSGTLQ